MRIGELSRRTGLSRDTIRFYERNGLICSVLPDGGSNNYRDYPEIAVERLAMISEARDAGFTIKDLRRLLQHIEGAVDAPFEADPFLDEKIEELTRLIERSKRLLAILRQTKAAIRGPH
ncbi:MAG: MerR family transcriptional regulator [Rhizobiaceae bacterium]|nr:MerR family transcriptional regulator [Rhizobiaceae bacterium]